MHPLWRRVQDKMASPIDTVVSARAAPTGRQHHSPVVHAGPRGCHARRGTRLAGRNADAVGQGVQSQQLAGGGARPLSNKYVMRRTVRP